MLGRYRGSSPGANAEALRKARKRRTGIEPASSPWKGEALPLSYRRTRETSTTSGPATMTVCTNDVALRDLVQDSLPIASLSPLPTSNALSRRWSNSRTQPDRSCRRIDRDGSSCRAARASDDATRIPSASLLSVQRPHLRSTAQFSPTNRTLVPVTSSPRPRCVPRHGTSSAPAARR